MLYDYTTRTPDTINEMVSQAISAGEELVDAILAVDGERTFANTMRPLEDIAARVDDVDGKGPFLAYVDGDEEVREAARDAEQRLRQWATDLIFRDDLYEAVRSYASTEDAAMLDEEAKRFLDFTMRDFRRAGHELSATHRKRLQEIRQRLITLEVEFARNVAEHEDFLMVSDGDLAGMPDSFIETLEPGDSEGTYKVTLAYPHVFPFLDDAERRDLRRELYYKFHNRAANKNPEVLSEAVALRLEIAELFDLPSWAHYRLEDKMAKDPARVEAFYEDLLPRMTKKGEDELSVMRDLLEKDAGDRDIQAWDYRFYENRLRKTDYGVDQSEVAEYFPLDQVIDGMFEITSEVFGLRYMEIENQGAWHPDVKIFELRNQESDELLAHFYMDLFPREGTFGHAAAWSLVTGRKNADGSRVTPVSAVVANLPKPTQDRPSLLRHDDVVTLFHEFGHVLHKCLSKASFARFSGARTERDFVEAPSQIMEHWCWQPEVLQRFARHHETGEPIPPDLVAQLTAARNLNTGLFHLGQAAYGQFDLAIHGPGDQKDIDALWREAYAIRLFPFPEGTNQPANFEHLMSDYDAGYYGYMWSKVFGDDMFSRFEDEGFTNPELGRRYRATILEPNATKDGEELLRDFLGRQPDQEAFLRYNGFE